MIHRSSDRSAADCALIAHNLPPELRTTIYDMAFSYPDQGLFMSGHKGPRFAILPADSEPKFALRDSLAADVLVTRPVKQILSPLLTCRQFYTEAMPAFYRTNQFFFTDMVGLHACLSNMPAKRMTHLASISVEYCTSEGNIAPRTVKLLSQIEHLRKLTIQTNEREWLMRSVPYGIGSGKVPDYTEEEKRKVLCRVPGMAGLRAMRGLVEATFFGPCATIEDILKPELLKPKGAIGTTKPTAEAKAKRKTGRDETKPPKKRTVKKSKQEKPAKG